MGGLRLQALKQAPGQDSGEQDPYASRRTALTGEKRLRILTSHQVLKRPSLRGVGPVLEEPLPLQEAVGGPVARPTLVTALVPYPGEARRDAWLRLKEQLGAGVETAGQKFARMP